MTENLIQYPIKDAYVDSSTKITSQVSKAHYFIGYFKKKNKYRTFLQYDFSEVKNKEKISHAMLRLYCIRNDNVTDRVKLDIHKVNSSWDANLISFENQPEIETKYKITKSVEGIFSSYIEIDITRYVTEWLETPDKNFGLLIKASDETDQASLIAIASQNQEHSNIRPIISIQFFEDSLKTPLIPNPKVAILTPQFFQFNGTRCLFGGGERYLIDLAKLLQKLGYVVEVFQPSTVGAWTNYYDGIQINGIGEPGVDHDFYIGLNKQFYQVTKSFDYHLYFNLDTFYPYTFPQSIGISHGIWWDSSERHWWRSSKWYDYMFNGLSGINTLVSVDTNTINWIHAAQPALKCKKVYIPNYVDLNRFMPDQESSQKDEVTILFPRRLCSARGFDITMELAFELTNEYPNITFSFVGRAGFEDIEKYMEIVSSKNTQINYAWYDMDEMFKAYENADIVLIPSLYSEGTSLSLLEAMACGKPVIAGLVGGLTDLIFQGYNGYLIEITKENLKTAIIDLMENPMKRIEMGKRAREVAEKFSKEIWEERWTSVLLKQFPKA